ncbi:unnamed protein product [Clonostachys chloroleuca]|uniref:Alcohol acetyltransferase n=1 Tax=Clonostachys chloroleuca TaxID=1926264 RepID=A0AA35LZ95_9HYPO|nr:unnamed protein product [Clonostachys chloroleuca]
MEESKARIVRPLGPWEQFSSARHHLGVYRCVVVTVRYEIPHGLENTRAALVAALASVVGGQPMLQVGIVGQETNQPAFIHLPEIDLRDHFELRSQKHTTVEEYEAKISETHGWLHDQLWPNIESKAPWKVLALQQESNGLFQTPVIDILFAYHHSLADGTGGKDFHQHLAAALNTQDRGDILLEPRYILSFPNVAELPQTQEEAIPFTRSWPFVLKATWDHLAPSLLKPKGPTPWTGRPIDFALPYITRIHPLHFSPESLQTLIKASRDHSSSLTALLHAMALASLATRLDPKDAESFVSMTPINLRPWVSPSVKETLKTKMRSLVTGLDTPFPASVVGALRSPHADRDELIWQAAKETKRLLDQRVSTLPSDDVAGLLHLIPDFTEYFRGLDGKPRAATWEVSNIGVLRCADSNGGWEPARGMFSNGAMVAGAGIALSVISIEKHGLTVTLSWQQDIVDEPLVMGLAQDLTRFVNGISLYKSESKM